MTLHPEKAARLEQTQRELSRLHQEIQLWLDRAKHDDPAGFHKSKLEAISATLLGAASDLDDHLRHLDLDLPLNELYAECRNYDQAIVWLRRMSDFVREKFDQRADPVLGRLLRAADEVAWSCYRPAYLLAPQRDSSLPRHPPPPLVFIDAEYSPGAFLSDSPLLLSLSLRLSASANFAFLDQYLQALPVPLVRIPPWCVDSPWWLVYIGHEIGHHIQHDLRLVTFFEQGLYQLADANEERISTAEVWKGWGEEIFADLFSVIMLGSWAVWAMAEAERSTPAQMIAYKRKYPPPVIRLALMAHTADRLGMDGTGALGALDLQAIAAQAEKTTADLGFVDAVVDFALGNLGDNLGTLVSLCGMTAPGDATNDPKRFKNGEALVQRISKLLLDGGKLGLPKDDLTSARRIAGGSVAAWAALTAQPSEIRNAHRDALAAQTITRLIEHAPGGTRPAATIDRRTDLADFLISRSRQSADVEQTDREGSDAVSG